ncbi:MAG TPA: amino acid adenylation domain-containing protein [Pyrinomonadaceae bacterium]|nr:amino acid adenylation domain-containing protein [Pyrinomonadaceae bacterium]
MNSVQSKTLTFDRELIEERDYWVEKLSHASGSASLRLDHDRAASDVSEISAVEINLPHATIAKLAKITGDSPFLVNAVLMATLKICLYKYTGSNTVTVGTPCRRRDEGPAPKPNALAMIDHVDGQLTVREFLMNVRATLVDGYARQNYPFARLVKDLGLETSRCPLFDIALVFQNIHGPLPELTNDITITFVKSEIGISGRVEYRSKLFNNDTIERLTTHWMNLLNAALDNVETRICDLQMLTDAERHQLLVEWNDTATAFANDSCIHELFEAQAVKSPEAVALVFDGEQLSYRELNERANQLARHLRTRGVGPETLVAVCMERCFELVIGVLGVLKAGGAYVPLDSANPGERLAFVLNDTHARVLLSKESLLEKLTACDAELVCLGRDWEIISRESSENLARSATPDNLAYVIYTSGSTGQPKGVMIKHQGVCNLAEAQSRAFGVRADSRVLQFAPSCFDASVSEIFMALTTGAALCLGNRNDLFYGSALAGLLHEQSITTVTLPPTALSTLTDDEFSALETIIVAGESCPAGIAARWSNGRNFFNAYGPTEVTVCASIMKCTAEYPDGPPIGYPMSNMQIYLLDSDLQPVPCGVPGELYVGGAGVGRGYLNRPELTAEKFIPDPLSEQAGARLYKTGDLAMYQPDGAIAFLGRIDHQVKLRGYRIELGEIEAVLAKHPSVREAVVIARDDVRGLKRLIAYVVSNAELSAEALKTFLSNCLPDYMIPAAFVMLDELPLTVSGKIDRRALPEPEQQDDEQSLGFVPPATAIEEMLAGIWSELLGKRQVGIHQSFFELGGHSLLATQILSRVREVFKVELPLFELFERPTVAQQAASVEALLRAGEQLDAPPIVRVARNIDLPLSFAQQRLWFLDQLKPNSSFYNIPSAVRLRGTLDIAALEQSFREITRRHEPLRTRFGLVDGVPLQLIDEPQDFHLPVFDLRTVDEAEREADARSLAAVEAQRPFDLSSGPLLRASVVRLADDDHMLLCTMHHIISDGWSMGVLIRELTTLYEAYSTGRNSPLPDLEIQYADFAHWQRAWLQGEVLEKQLAYWKKQLAGAPAVLELPTDYSRPAVQTYSGATQFFVLPAALREQLEDLSRTNSATLFMTLLAAFQTLLSRYSRQSDVVVGSPIANRNRAETESLIGFFVNTLVLRTDLSGDPSFRELLGRVREVALGAYAHQDVPFELLVEELQPERSLAHTPLFQVVFTLQNAPMPRAELDKLSVAGLAVERATAKFDLGLNISGTPGELQGALEYNTDLFDAATIRRMVSHLEILLANVVSNPDQRLSELPLLTPAEVEHVVFEWNDTAVDYPREKCIHQLFEVQVERTPEAVAVICADQQLTYRELNERANRLAHYLQSNGAGPIIGICMQRSVEMMVGLLGILKSGAAYVPVDPQHPAARVTSTLADAGVRLLLTQRSLADRCEGVATLCLDEELPEMPVTNPRDTARAENLAYVIYTSGSTGQPKGVRISHRSAVNYLCWARDTYLREEVLNSALYSSLAFDLTVTSIYVPLISGGATIVFAEQEVGRALDQIVRDERVGLLKVTPSHLMLLAGELGVGPERETGRVGVKRLVVGGEALSSQLARGIQDGLGSDVEIYNEYGPTEATVGCMIYRYQPAPAERAMVPIGRPAANMQIYILDERLNPVADYVEGEIYIGGVGVAEGYQGRAEQTAERFVGNPFRQGERMYRSGDMGRRLANGEVEFLGRRDQQVKVRGHRVELDELREKLNEHPDIRDSVVVITGHGAEAVLVAYYVSRQELEVGKLRVWLRDRVIEETIPNVFVRLKRMPLTVNGKINYAALPAPEHIRPKMAQSYVAPRTPTEEILAGIYADVLGLERVGVLDNFFEMGGHSLLATQVIARLRVSFQIEMPLRHMFEQPTVAGLAAIVIETQAAQADSDEIAQILEELNQLSEDEAESLLQPK